VEGVVVGGAQGAPETGVRMLMLLEAAEKEQAQKNWRRNLYEISLQSRLK